MTLGFIAEFSFLVLHCQTEPRNFLIVATDSTISYIILEI